MRPLEPGELERVRRALQPFGDAFLDEWLADARAELWRDQSQAPRLYLVRRTLANRLRDAPSDPAPVAVGLLVGELERDRVRLHLEGAHEVGRRSRAASAIVEDKAAQLFLYGRDVFAESVVSKPRKFLDDDRVLVCNRRGDVLGLARALRPWPRRGRALTPVRDRGWYLRSGG